MSCHTNLYKTKEEQREKERESISWVVLRDHTFTWYNLRNIYITLYITIYLNTSFHKRAWWLPNIQFKSLSSRATPVNQICTRAAPCSPSLVITKRFVLLVFNQGQEKTKYVLQQSIKHCLRYFIQFATLCFRSLIV